MAAVEEPKKPMSAYFLYTQEKREAVQKELGVKDFGPITKCLSDRWKKLSASDKATFEKKAAQVKAQYEKDLEAYKAAGGVVGQKRKDKKDAKAAKASKKAKKEANADKPKAPVGGAYGIFMNMNRAEIAKTVPAGSAVTAVSKVAGERWKAMPEKEKAVYEAKYKEKKAAYEKELEAWKASKAAEKGDDDEDDEENDEEEQQEQAAPKKKARKLGA